MHKARGQKRARGSSVQYPASMSSSGQRFSKTTTPFAEAFFISLQGSAVAEAHADACRTREGTSHTHKLAEAPRGRV